MFVCAHSHFTALLPACLSCCRYFTWKGRTYWFGGNDTQQSLAEAAAAYKVRVPHLVPL
jgi:hypothetical protein